MKKMIILFLSSILLFVNFSCKYEEGPLISLESKFQRISGVYKMSSFCINGVESIDRYQNECNCKWRFIFDEDNDHELNLRLTNCVIDSISGHYQFCDKGYLLIRLDPSTPNYYCVYYDPIRSVSTILWDIRRLTTDELWLETTCNENNYYLKLINE
jgi:hypothetical protein